jgi:arylsulfatase A-like enzyme
LRKRAASANVVVCVIDGARADHIGCYGYPRQTTPNIDRLAAESVVFEQHFVPFPLTKPSTASLFTGQYPDTHLVVWREDVLDPDGFSMANALESYGFQTVFLSSNPLASPWWGLGTDFEFICGREKAKRPGSALPGSGRPDNGRAGWPGASNWKTPEGLVAALEGWLDREQAGRFFVYIHFLPPHIPYEAPEEIQELFDGGSPPRTWQGEFAFPEIAERRTMESPPLDEWVNAYDANLRWADWAVGETEKALRERGLLDNTLFMVISDHGEGFGEHGYEYHLGGVYDELLRVPLLVRLPGVERLRGRVGALTQTVDVLPTVLDLLQIRSPEDHIQGHSLLSLLSGDAEVIRDYVYARCGSGKPSYLVRDQHWALVVWEGAELQALYDLRTDPRQTRNVIAEHPQQAAQMVSAFRQFAAGQADPPMEFVDPAAAPAEPRRSPVPKLRDDELRDLRALGYVE